MFFRKIKLSRFCTHRIRFGFVRDVFVRVRNVDGIYIKEISLNRVVRDRDKPTFVHGAFLRIRHFLFSVAQKRDISICEGGLC